MPHRLEIALKPELFDAVGEGVRQKAKNYFGIELSGVRTVNIVTIDADLSAEQLKSIQQKIFTNPVTEVSSYRPLDIDFDWNIWVGYRPGVRDNPGSTAVEAIEDILGIKLAKGEAVYTSRRYCVRGDDLTVKDAHKIAGELLANGIIQQTKVLAKKEWDPKIGIGYIIPKVKLDRVPTVVSIPIKSDASLQKISDDRNLALNPNDIPTIRAYFLDKDVRAERKKVGLSDPTDIELEYISQARSDHCLGNIFKFYIGRI